MLNVDGRALGESVQEGATPEHIDVDLDVAGPYFIEVAVDPSRPADPDNPYRLQFALQNPPARPQAGFDGVAPAVVPQTTAPAVPTLVPTVAPVSPSGPVTLSVTPTDVAWSRPVTVSWANVPEPSRDAWFELFRPDDDSSSSTVPNAAGAGSRRYVSCETSTPVAARPSGDCTFTLDPSNVVRDSQNRNIGASTYEFRLYAASGTFLARSGPITFRSNAVATNSGASIQATPSSVSSKTSITVTWANIPDATKYAWFELFRPDDETSSSTVPIAEYSRRYVSCEPYTPVSAKASGSCSLTIDPHDIVRDAQNRAVGSATYEFRLFSDDNNRTLMARSGTVVFTAK